MGKRRWVEVGEPPLLAYSKRQAAIQIFAAQLQSVLNNDPAFLEECFRILRVGCNRKLIEALLGSCLKENINENSTDEWQDTLRQAVKLNQAKGRLDQLTGQAYKDVMKVKLIARLKTLLINKKLYTLKNKGECRREEHGVIKDIVLFETAGDFEIRFILTKADGSENTITNPPEKLLRDLIIE